MATKKDIILQVGEKELKFSVGIADYNNYINEIDMKNKVVPAKRFLRNTLADKKDMDALDKLMESGLVLELLGNITEEFVPKVEITVKK